MPREATAEVALDRRHRRRGIVGAEEARRDLPQRLELQPRGEEGRRYGGRVSMRGEGLHARCHILPGQRRQPVFSVQSAPGSDRGFDSQGTFHLPC